MDLEARFAAVHDVSLAQDEKQAGHWDEEAAREMHAESEVPGSERSAAAAGNRVARGASASSASSALRRRSSDKTTKKSMIAGEIAYATRDTAC